MDGDAVVRGHSVLNEGNANVQALMLVELHFIRFGLEAKGGYEGDGKSMRGEELTEVEERGGVAVQGAWHCHCVRASSSMRVHSQGKCL